MAKSMEAYVDNRGRIHRDPTDAVVADLADALGRAGDHSGMAEGVARVILSKRAEIEQAFEDLDHLIHHAEAEIEIEDKDLGQVIRIGRGQRNHE